ncbi:uncharacterized protein N7500_006894 [Penicillium coprophilum]|uniref:uncharacterized protein n=1 Tax=Penicillium coprophilum TaxID=36646 RepID=UPI002382A3B4|nr:uncharacterized protein N7500_006894 [Penicillium coprophilum]KAJ5165064.1 hypothetical protein N7500_006894 [Penicillium coprophilum]
MRAASLTKLGRAANPADSEEIDVENHIVELSTFKKSDLVVAKDAHAGFVPWLPALSWEAFIAARFPLRGLVTCAVVSRIGQSIGFSINVMSRIIDVNRAGTLTCAWSAARVLFKQDFPANMVLIANISDHVVKKGIDAAACGSSRAGVHQFTRNLASEWGSPKGGPVIRVKSLSPGYIRKCMTEGLWKDPMQ